MSNQKRCVIITALGSTGLTRCILNWSFSINNQSKVRWDAPEHTGGRVRTFPLYRWSMCAPVSIFHWGYLWGPDETGTMFLTWATFSSPKLPAALVGVWTCDLPRQRSRETPPGCFCEGSARMSLDWDSVDPSTRRTPSPVNDFSPRKQTASGNHKQNPFPAHCLQTHLSFPRPPPLALLTDSFWSTTLIWFIINSKWSNQ